MKIAILIGLTCLTVLFSGCVSEQNSDVFFKLEGGPGVNAVIDKDGVFEIKYGGEEINCISGKLPLEKLQEFESFLDSIEMGAIQNTSGTQSPIENFLCTSVKFSFLRRGEYVAVEIPCADQPESEMNPEARKAAQVLGNIIKKLKDLTAPYEHSCPYIEELDKGKLLQIAQNSECFKEGESSGAFSYTPGTRTYKIGLNLGVENINSNCVIFEDNLTAKVDYGQLKFPRPEGVSEEDYERPADLRTIELLAKDYLEKMDMFKEKPTATIKGVNYPMNQSLYWDYREPEKKDSWSATVSWEYTKELRGGGRSLPQMSTTIISTASCNADKGMIVNVVDGSNCEDYEEDIGYIYGFKSPHICCRTTYTEENECLNNNGRIIDDEYCNIGEYLYGKILDSEPTKYCCKTYS